MEKVMDKSTDSWSMNVQCNTCGVHWKIEAKDVVKKSQPYGLHPGDWECSGSYDEYGIICHECGHFTRINESELPVEVKYHSKYVPKSESNHKTKKGMLDKFVNIFK